MKVSTNDPFLSCLSEELLLGLTTIPEPTVPNQESDPIQYGPVLEPEPVIPVRTANFLLFLIQMFKNKKS